MISKILKSRFRTLSVNSYVSTKSIQGLLLFFQILGLFLIMARDFANFDRKKLIFMIALISFVYISGKLVQKFTRGDYYIMLIANMLFSIGILEIYRLNDKLAFRQIIWFCIGIIAFWSNWFSISWEIPLPSCPNTYALLFLFSTTSL